MIQPYLVLSQRTIRSKSHGHPITEITLIGCSDRCQYKTYIDIQNKNYRNWQHIVNNPKKGFALGNLIIKNSSKYLISADSELTIDIKSDRPEQLLSELYEIWIEQDQKKNTNKFRDLFE